MKQTVYADLGKLFETSCRDLGKVSRGLRKLTWELNRLGRGAEKVQQGFKTLAKDLGKPGQGLEKNRFGIREDRFVIWLLGI